MELMTYLPPTATKYTDQLAITHASMTAFAAMMLIVVTLNGTRLALIQFWKILTIV